MVRSSLPETRTGKTHRLVIYADGGDIDLYVRTGEYEDGALGEVFVSIGKQGSTLQAMLDGWATLFSLCLQYGAPPATLIERFRHTQFPPNDRECSSVFDAVVAWLETEYAR